MEESSYPSIFWNQLSQEEKRDFLQTRNAFHQAQKGTGKDRRVVSFRRELLSVLNFIEKSEIHKDIRSILVGLCFAGPFICVNTRTLKGFLGRCKSSINGSFQQMGYAAVRTKSKARNCVLAVLPNLAEDQITLRQWTVRYATNDVEFCYLSSFRFVQLPTITEADLVEEKKPLINQLSHGLSGGIDLKPKIQQIPSNYLMTVSYSMESFVTFEDKDCFYTGMDDISDDIMWGTQRDISHSTSMNFSLMDD